MWSGRRLRKGRRASEKVELSADWRAHDPVILNIGPVLDADDAIANKVCALFGRALLGLPAGGRV